MRRFFMATFVLVVFVGTALGSPFTPLEWQGRIKGADGGEAVGKLVTWNRDRDHDFIDDLLANRRPDERVDVIVDFNRCVTCCEEGEDEALSYLRRLGKIDHVSRIVTFAVVLGVPVSELRAIAERPEVAMVEWLVPAQGGLDVSSAAVRMSASATFSPDTAEDAFPAITGAGQTIAVIDSGVDNAGGPGTTNDMFPAGTLTFGANCINNPCTVADPDDDHGHGSNVAGIALGRAIPCGGGTCRGIAPGANLVDIKVLNSANFCVGASCIRGLELAVTNRDLWSIDVLNVSIGDCAASNGQNAVAQLINTAVSLGLVVAVCQFNSSNCGLPNGSALVNNWASASLGIWVAAANDGNTVPLGNDALAGFSLLGPRMDDGDGDARDEQKPEIAAPGQSILSAARDSAAGTSAFSGTSQAAPHVAGAAALIQQRFPGINPGSVKELLIATAAQSNKPGPHPGYDVGWGFGFLDVFAALNRAPVTDIGRPTEPPYAPCGAGWCSPHIATASAPKINIANTITAQVRNFSATMANGTRVCFGVYVFSNNFNRFFELGCALANLPGNSTTPVALPWTPAPALVPPGFPATDPVHACIKVSIDYPFDSNFANNELQRNVSVAQASIARVPFRLENNLTEEARIEVRTETRSRWKARITENGKPVDAAIFTMKPDECPRNLVVEMIPPTGAKKGDRATFVVRAIANGEIDFGGIVVDTVVAHEEQKQVGFFRRLWRWLRGRH
ncbi:MAG: S8 family peptidase [Thermoanaerobaculia bacterium]